MSHWLCRWPLLEAALAYLPAPLANGWAGTLRVWMITPAFQRRSAAFVACVALTLTGQSACRAGGEG